MTDSVKSLDIIKEIEKLGYSIYQCPRFLRSDIFEVRQAGKVVAEDTDPYRAICKALMIYIEAQKLF